MGAGEIIASLPRVSADAHRSRLWCSSGQNHPLILWCQVGSIAQAAEEVTSTTSDASEAVPRSMSEALKQDDT